MYARRRLAGDQLSMLPGVLPYWINPNNCSGGDERSPVMEQLSLVEIESVQKVVRRHSPKGAASGWIEARKGNQKRKKPSISYYYRWDSPEGRVNEYVRANRLARINQLIAEKRPALEILKIVTEGKKLSGVSAKLLNGPIS